MIATLLTKQPPATSSTKSVYGPTASWYCLDTGTTSIVRSSNESLLTGIPRPWMVYAGFVVPVGKDLSLWKTPFPLAQRFRDRKSKDEESPLIGSRPNCTTIVEVVSMNNHYGKVVGPDADLVETVEDGCFVSLSMKWYCCWCRGQVVTAMVIWTVIVVAAALVLGFSEESLLAEA